MVQKLSAPLGMRMVRSVPKKDKHYVAVDYKTMASNVYAELHLKLAFHGRSQRTAFDPRFWKLEHQDIYESICLLPRSHMCSPHKHIDIPFIVKNEMKLGQEGYSIHSHATNGIALQPKALAPLYPPGHASKAVGTSTAMIPKYAFLFKCLTWTLVPKSGDYISVRNFAIDLMLEMAILDQKLNVADFIFHEMRLASYSQGRSLPYGPFIQAMIEDAFEPSIQLDCSHKVWSPRFDNKKKAPMPVVAPTSISVVSPLSRFEKFMAKAQRSIFNMCKFNAQEVVNHNKLAYDRVKVYKDRLRALVIPK
ncbi:hypothetical protein ACQ4PT_000752 [Festuca glaucescens]